MNQLQRRLLVAAWGIPLSVAVVYIGGWAFTLFITVICAGCLIEYYKLADLKGLSVNLAIVGGITLPIVHFVFPLYLLEYISCWILLIIVTSTNQGLDKIQSRTGISVAGIIYPALFLSYFVPIRNAGWSGIWGEHVSGTLIILYILSTIWICDTAAYAGGKAVGKHKLAPVVSPNKTWEGFFSGLLGGVFWAFLFSFLLEGMLTVPEVIGGAVIVGIVGQLGDLAESAIKRFSGVKDSGSFFGPHGGFLDRFDSLIVVAPVFYVYFKLLSVI